MALPTCNEDMNIISKLDDEPNDVGGLSAASLKAKFDLAGNLLYHIMRYVLRLCPTLLSLRIKFRKRKRDKAQYGGTCTHSIRTPWFQ